MVEFLRGILCGTFKWTAYLAVSGLAAGIIAANIASRADFNMFFCCSWLAILLLLFTFPEILKWLNKPL